PAQRRRSLGLLRWTCRHWSGRSGYCWLGCRCRYSILRFQEDRLLGCSRGIARCAQLRRHLTRFPHHFGTVTCRSHIAGCFLLCSLTVAVGRISSFTDVCPPSAGYKSGRWTSSPGCLWPSRPRCSASVLSDMLALTSSTRCSRMGVGGEPVAGWCNSSP